MNEHAKIKRMISQHEQRTRQHEHDAREQRAHVNARNERTRAHDERTRNTRAHVNAYAHTLNDAHAHNAQTNDAHTINEFCVTFRISQCQRNINSFKNSFIRALKEHVKEFTNINMANLDVNANDEFLNAIDEIMELSAYYNSIKNRAIKQHNNKKIQNLIDDLIFYKKSFVIKTKSTFKKQFEFKFDVNDVSKRINEKHLSPQNIEHAKFITFQFVRTQ